jgi:hypothetical protein
MKKKKIVLGLVALFVLCISSYFLWTGLGKVNKEDDDFRNRFVTYSDFIKEEREGISVYRSDKAGIAMSISSDWSMVDEDFGFISFKSDDFVPYGNDWSKRPIASSGCWMEVNIVIEKQAEDYRNLIKEYIDNEEYVNSDEDEDEQIIDLGYSKAVMTTIRSESLDGSISYIQIPQGNITYNFNAYLFGKDKERCQEDFDSFLASLAIEEADEIE